MYGIHLNQSGFLIVYIHIHSIFFLSANSFQLLIFAYQPCQFKNGSFFKSDVIEVRDNVTDFETDFKMERQKKIVVRRFQYIYIISIWCIILHQIEEMSLSISIHSNYCYYE